MAPYSQGGSATGLSATDAHESLPMMREAYHDVKLFARNCVAASADDEGPKEVWTTRVDPPYREHPQHDRGTR